MAFSMFAGQPLGSQVFAAGAGSWRLPRFLTAQNAGLSLGLRSLALEGWGCPLGADLLGQQAQAWGFARVASTQGLRGFGQQQIFNDLLRQGLVYDLPDAQLASYGKSILLIDLLKQGSLFVTVTYQDAVGTQFLLRVSNETISQGQFLWQQKLVTLPQVTFRAKELGGYVALNWGALTFLPDAFADAQGNVMAPPQKISVKAEWGPTDRTMRLIFEGHAFLRSRNPDEVGYDLFEKEFKVNALEMGAEYGSTLDLNYVDASVTGELTFTLESGTHAFKVGDEVVIQPRDNATLYAFTGLGSIKAVGGNTSFTIAFAGEQASGAIVAEVSSQLKPIPLVVGFYEHAVLLRTGRETTGSRFYLPSGVGSLVDEAPAYAGLGFALYDDSVELGAASGWVGASPQRYLAHASSQPFGALSLVGTGGSVSLFALFAWACARLNLTLQVSPTDEPDVPLSFCLQQQMSLIDLLDKVAGYCNFSFFIRDNSLTLFNNATPQGDVGFLSDLDVFSLDYEYSMPSKAYVARWKRFQPGSKRVNDVATPVLEEVEVVAEVAGQTGVGDVRSYSDVFEQNSVLVKSNLRRLKAEREAMTLRLKIPLERLPNLGEQFSYLDQEMNPVAVARGFVRGITFDFENDTIDLIAKGSLQ